MRERGRSKAGRGGKRKGPRRGPRILIYNKL
jgi:hypothetical protein